MTDFAAIWDRQIPADLKASVIAGITANGINGYLKAHRVHDAKRYHVQREFKDGEQTMLRITLIVGGSQDEHDNGQARPLVVSFPTPGISAITANYRSLYDFPSDDGTFSVEHFPERLPNVVMSARNLNLYMEWPNSAGGAWQHHQGGIDFDLEVRLDLVEEDGRISLGFVPVKLHVSRSAEAALRKSMVSALAAQSHSALPSAADPKIADLIMAVLELAATTIGPDLSRSIVVPVLEFEKFDATPTALAIGDNVVSVSAHLDFNRAMDLARSRIEALSSGLLDAVEQDMAANDGGIELLFDREVLAKAEALSPDERWDYLAAQPTRSEKEIEALMVHSRAFCNLQLEALHAEMHRFGGSESLAPSSLSVAAREDLGVAINKETLGRLVADIGGITRQGFTRHASVWLARGRLGYQLRVGTPEMDVTAAGQLEGTVDIDVFAGLYYQLRRWNGRWGSERRIGLGVKGDPKLRVKAVRSNGLSILAEVDLGGLRIQTGLGSIIDKLINLLITPFKKAVELILNGMLSLLSFVVVPARFAVPGQRTGVQLSQFVTSRYLRHQATNARSKFLLVKCDLNGVKLG